MLVESCELLVLVKETKNDLGDDTRIEEKERQRGKVNLSRVRLEELYCLKG